jgi:hypothetical protein
MAAGDRLRQRQRDPRGVSAAAALQVLEQCFFSFFYSLIDSLMISSVMITGRERVRW